LIVAPSAVAAGQEQSVTTVSFEVPPVVSGGADHNGPLQRDPELAVAMPRVDPGFGDLI
jgi:hypothetical protein